MKWLLLITLALAMPCRAVDFSTLTYQGTTFTLTRVNLDKEQLRLFLRDDEHKPLKSFAKIDAWLKPKGEQLVFAVNAGMYHGDFSPVGLCVIDGIQLTPLNLADDKGNFFLKPNGVFGITSRGALVSESTKLAKHPEKFLLATQSGPMLVIDGRIHHAFIVGSSNRLYRNGVGIVSAKEVVFAISEGPVNFHDFATLFRDALHCQNALFLDGTVSSLHAPSLKRSDKKMDLGPIIGITARLPD